MTSHCLFYPTPWVLGYMPMLGGTPPLARVGGLILPLLFRESQSIGVCNSTRDALAFKGWRCWLHNKPMSLWNRCRSSSSWWEFTLMSCSFDLFCHAQCQWFCWKLLLHMWQGPMKWRACKAIKIMFIDHPFQQTKSPRNKHGDEAPQVARPC
jgi:hypothetical protein